MGYDDHYSFFFSRGRKAILLWTSPGGYWDEALAESQYPDESTNRFVRVKNNIFLYTEVNFLILLKYNFILVENSVAW